MHRSLGFLAALLLISAAIAGCAPAATPPTPTPSVPLGPPSITTNADWTPLFESFDGIEMALVPPGCFMMGNDEGRRDERPAHQLCLERAFWIGRTEVTNAQYGSEGAFPGADRPRENLTWFEARDFCAARGLRLPTEAEWEYAARGPDNLLYPWGSELIEDNLVFDRNSGNQTAAVGSRPAGVSWVGALDMSGNVLEWTSSLYARYPYDAADGRENSADTTGERVQRSGWGSYIDFGASAPIRFRAAPDARDWFVGFRCARDYQAE